jgi:multiple sugar transport system permease protein
MSVATPTVAVVPAAAPKKKWFQYITGYGFMAPAMVVMILFLIVPMLLAAFLSLTNWDGVKPLVLPNAFDFIGLKNYQTLLFSGTIRQSVFFESIRNTLYFVLGVVPVQTFLALVLATIVNQRWLRRKGFFRTAFYFPSITSSVVISIIFLWMFSQSGLINAGLHLIFPSYAGINWLANDNGLIHMFLNLFGINEQTIGAWGSTEVAGLTLWEWLKGPSVTMFTIMMLNTWTTIGTLMVIYLSALQGISGSVYEAASVDGATGWQIFRKITVPLLRPTTFFVVTLGLIGTFQVFDQVYVISSGANSTSTIAYYVYNAGYKDAKMGLSTAAAIILFAIIFVITQVQRRITSDRAND